MFWKYPVQIFTNIVVPTNYFDMTNDCDATYAIPLEIH